MDVFEEFARVGTLTFKVPPFVQFLNKEGEQVAESEILSCGKGQLFSLYEWMVLVRMFDEKAVKLQQTGKLGTYPPCKGQEAIGVGIGAAMGDDDVFAPQYRTQATQLMRGVTPTELFLFWAGDERGSDFQNAPACNDFPVAIPIASQAPHAVGRARAKQLLGEAGAVVCDVGDGGTSEGDFYEAMNIAGAWKVPVVFVVSNNQWAISVPRNTQTASATIAQKAIAAGFAGRIVDGNDVVAVCEVVTDALHCARDGRGPTLIEAVTYRMGPHTTADDPTRYRSDNETEVMRAYDPIDRVRLFLCHQGVSMAELEEVQKCCEQKIDAAVEEYQKLLKDNPRRPEAMFESLYGTLPEALIPQLSAIVAKAEQIKEDEDDG